MATKIKWLMVFLALSLAVNIFIGGVMLGKEFRPTPSRDHGRAAIGFNIKRFQAYLTKAEKRKIREILADQRQDLADHYHAIREGETLIKSLISAKEVDRAALLEALENHAALMRQIHAPLQRVIMEVMAELDQETRQKIAKDMFRRDHRRSVRFKEARHRKKDG